MNSSPHRYSNPLIHESSPYLLQHAHNPVNWRAWNDESLSIAKEQNKLLLISIGYSACHWCHVMEKESFENEQVAQLMNDYFVCIKVDREERPDIDQVYMLAVQLMTGQGGWPLNCIALPDGRPIYGGTYFQKEQWMNVLLSVADLYRNDPGKARDYAERLTKGIQQAEQLVPGEPFDSFDKNFLQETVSNWKPRFDNEEGGANRAPKFPLPDNYQFLMYYAFVSCDAEVKRHVQITLDKMAAGGIYDQIGGGFARYSVDGQWKVPHFEKMLYDNAQLISLYANAANYFSRDSYRQVVIETVEFVMRELRSDEHCFYSALDADSEGIEGKFYTWNKSELQALLGEEFDRFAVYYNVNARGLWEDERYILLKTAEDAALAKMFGCELEELQAQLKRWKVRLLAARENRVRPGLDDKSLTSWNALMIRALADAYTAVGDSAYLDQAKKSMDWLLRQQKKSDGSLFHSYKLRKSAINAYLEDYCFVIEALIALYQITLDENYIREADNFTTYVIRHFSDPHTDMFFFTSDEDPALITRKMELSDNVIPASNSSMAKVLFQLGNLFGNNDYLERSKRMLRYVLSEMILYGAGYSNWAQLLIHHVFPFYEVAVVGKSVNEKLSQLQNHYLPNVIFAGTAGESQLPLLQNRSVSGKTLIYVCEGQHCLLPSESVENALQLLRQ